MRSKIFFIAFIFLCFIMACNKEPDFNYPEGTVGISKIIYYPSVAIKGDHLIIIHQGEAYTDPGVTALLKGQSIDFTTSGSVDVSTPGVYDLEYEAKNPEGYTATDWRTVVVIGENVAANDFSGTYLREATGVKSTWTKKADGVYTVDNPGGAGVGAGYLVTVVNYEGNKIKIPRQLATDPDGAIGIVSSRDEIYNASANPVTYKWVFLAGGYGTGLRTFKKL